MSRSTWAKVGPATQGGSRPRTGSRSGWDIGRRMLATLAGALGFRPRLSLDDRGGTQPLSVSPPHGGGQRALADRDLGVLREQVEREVQVLEARLEKLHAIIIRGDSRPVQKAGTATPTIGALIARTGRLREELQEKRYELARLERRIEREQRLHTHAAVQSKAAPSEPAPSIW